MAYILGLNNSCRHDASACLVHNGEILAFAEEERFTRIKHNRGGKDCKNSAAYCLSAADLRLQEIDHIALASNPRWPHASCAEEDRERAEALLPEAIFGPIDGQKVESVDHHVAHAASSFYCSGFDNAGVLVVDGAGDGLATSLFRGDSGGLHLLESYPYWQSLGWFYEAVTEAVGLGDWTSAGKLMGLAALGRPRHSLSFLVPCEGGYRFEGNIGSLDGVDLEARYRQLHYSPEVKEALARDLGNVGLLSSPERFAFCADTAELRRVTELGEAEADLAASAQQKLELCLQSLAKHLRKVANSSNLCLAGGVALNCAANGTIASSKIFHDIFVQPASGDSGCALGAALDVSYRMGDLHIPTNRLGSVSLGPSFSSAQVGEVLASSGLAYEYRGQEAIGDAAQLLAKGQVGGWFWGRMEAGPRALGSRSILGDARSAQMRDKLNKRVKDREDWRPFGPSIRADEIQTYVRALGPADFMIFAYEATPRAKSEIPGAVHADGTLRPHSVNKHACLEFYNLLTRYQEIAGVPALINTSFNRGEPIVCTPRQAIRTFCTTELDFLAIEGFIVKKNAH